MIFLVVLAWSSACVPAYAASLVWNNDNLDIRLNASSADTYTLQLGASRYVLTSPDVGHFKLNITRDGTDFVSSCISYGASASAVAVALDALDPVADLGGSEVVREGDGSSAYNYGFVYYISAVDRNSNLTDLVEIKLAGSGLEQNCARLSTLGYWGDEQNWDTGAVPASTDEVTIPADASFVILTADTIVSSLQLSGGALVTHDSTCLSGWTPAPGGTSSSFGGTKCYRVFDTALPWAAALDTCASAVSRQQAGVPRSGSLRGALVTVQSQEENRWVSRMCRSDPLERDCWLGMTRSYAGGNGVEIGDDFDWAELGRVVGDSRYRSWAVREPSDFENDEVGRNCVAMQGSRKLAADQAGGRWYSAECEAEKPFVCQAFGVSTPFVLTVSTELRLAGGYITGAGTVVSSTLTQVSGDEGEVGILHGATLQNSASGSIEWSAPHSVGWGGSLRNLGGLSFSGGTAMSLGAAGDGAGLFADNAGAWPTVINEEGAQIVLEDGSDVSLEWLLWNEGGSVEVNGALECTAGGYSSSGTLTVQEGAEVMFSNSSFIMHQTEVVALTLQADREVSGQDVETSAEAGGYYRLAFGGEETDCIRYHASGELVQEALENLLSVQEEGGVTVQRDGNGELERWNYGYRYVMNFDGARKLSSGNTLTFSCAGDTDDCGCVDVTGAIIDVGEIPVGCGAAAVSSANVGTSTSAVFDSSACRVQATVEVEKLSEGGETAVGGGGVMAFSEGGTYFLPSAMTARLEVSSAAEVVCPQWSPELVGAVNVSSSAVLWFAGANNEALDAVSLLQAEPDTPGRSSEATASPPRFSAIVDGDVNVQGGGEIRVATTHPASASAATEAAALTVLGSVTLAGGGLSGQGRVLVEGSTLVVLPSGAYGGDDTGADASSLRNGLTLDMYGGGEWTGGGLQARDGASVVNRGQLSLSSEGGISFGNGGDFGARAPLDFDGERWYANPLCGSSCMVEPWLENTAGGEIRGTESSNALLRFVLYNEGIVSVEDGGRLDWQAAGQGGGNGTIALSGLNSTIVFSDGGFVFGEKAALSGEGVLEFSGGSGHVLPQGAEEVSPLVKISGTGVVTFAGVNLAMGRGLSVLENGALVFSSDTSSTTISGELMLTGGGLIIFPRPSVYASLVLPGRADADAEAPWGPGEGDLDGGDGWGAASRSTLRVEGKFVWTGGAISGNARVICAGESEWSTSKTTTSTKRLLHSLQLVSRGAVVWSTGDVIASLGAAFVNQGTILFVEETTDATSVASSSSSGSSRSTGDGLPPRIRGPRKGEEAGLGGIFASDAVAALVDVDLDGTNAADGGAGSAGVGAASWAWEDLSYDPPGHQVS